VKYSSTHIRIATIRIKLRILPTPKNAKIRKKDNAVPAKRPRLVLAKTNEKVNKNAMNDSRKKRGTIPIKSGSTKKIITPVITHSRIVTISVGKKFFLLSTCSFLIDLRILLF
jgi:hypothetical protein